MAVDILRMGILDDVKNVGLHRSIFMAIFAVPLTKRLLENGLKGAFSGLTINYGS